MRLKEPEPFDGDPPERLLREQDEVMDRIMAKMQRWQKYALKHGWNTVVILGGYDPLTDCDFMRSHREGSHYHALGMSERWCARNKVEND